MEGAGSPASPENVPITTQGLQMPELWKQAGQTGRLSAVHSYRLSLSGSGAEPGADTGSSPPGVSNSVFWIMKM